MRCAAAGLLRTAASPPVNQRSPASSAFPLVSLSLSQSRVCRLSSAGQLSNAPLPLVLFTCWGAPCLLVSNRFSTLLNPCIAPAPHLPPGPTVIRYQAEIAATP